MCPWSRTHFFGVPAQRGDLQWPPFSWSFGPPRPSKLVEAVLSLFNKCSQGQGVSLDFHLLHTWAQSFITSAWALWGLFLFAQLCSLSQWERFFWITYKNRAISPAHLTSSSLIVLGGRPEPSRPWLSCRASLSGPAATLTALATDVRALPGSSLSRPTGKHSRPAWYT